MHNNNISYTNNQIGLVRSPSQPHERSLSQSNINYLNAAPGQYDIYENEDMADYFADDIDEMSICEGSRQS